MLKASKRFFCTTHVCAQSSNGRDPHLSFSETHMCMPTAATGRATLDPWVQPSLHIFCNTHVCVCAHSSNWSAKVGLGNPQLISSATHMSVCSAKVFRMLKTSKIFCTTHVCVYSCNCRDPHLTYSDTHTHAHVMCIQKHTCVCPQQQLVGQPLTLGCNPHLTYSANDFFIGLFCKCSQQQLVDQPWTRVRNLLKGSTHISVLTAANGWPTLDPWLQPLIALFCNTHVCVCSQQQLVCQLC